MKKIAKYLVVALCAICIMPVLSSCGEKELKTVNLGAVTNLKITVEGRIMTVTWDAVENAQGYLIVTTSVACSSADRTINTKEQKAIQASSGNAAANVEFVDATTIKLNLMAYSAENQIDPMATAVTASVIALGGKTANAVYADSPYFKSAKFAIIPNSEECPE